MFAPLRSPWRGPVSVTKIPPRAASPAGASPGPAWRVAKAALLALACAELAYVGGANYVLGGGAVARWLSPTDRSMALRYEGAWSVVPGFVHFENVALQGQDHNVQWRVEVGPGSVWLRPWPLVKREVSLTRLRAEGVAFRFRHRVRAEHAGQPAVAAYPPISGYDDPAVFDEPEGPDVDPTRAFRISLSDVDAGVRELWVQEFRYEGPGRVHGAFQLVPGAKLWVGPAELDLRGGALSAGGHAVARDLEATIRCDIPPFATKEPNGLEVLRHVSGAIELDAQVAGLAFLDLYGPPGGARVRDGSGQLSARLRFEHGVIGEGGSVRYDASHVVVRRGDAWAVAAPASARLLTDGDGASFALDVPSASLGSGEGAPIVWARALGASLELPPLDLASAESWQARSARAGVGEAGADDLARLHELSGRPEDWALRGGRARASAELRLSEKGEASGEARARVEGLALDAADTRWSGALSLAASLGPFAPRAGVEMPGAVRVEGRDVAFKPARGGGGHAGWWFALEGKGARFAFAPAFGGRASWALRARDLSPLTTVLASGGGAPAWLAKALDLEGLQGSGGVAYGGGRFDLDIASARAGALDAKGRYAVAPTGSRGAFVLAMGPLAVGLRLREGKVDVDWPVGDGWLADEARALGASRTR